MLQCVAGALVTGPHVFQALFADAVERSGERDHHGHRRGVMVGALRATRLAHVATQHAKVQVPGLRLRDAALPGPLVDGERCQTGGHTEALLRPGIADINAPVIGPQFDAADGGDRVHQQQRVPLGGSERGDVGADAGGGLCVHRRDDPGMRVRRDQSLGVHRLAPLEVDAHHVSAAAGGHVTHALPEQAVDADHDDVTGVHGVHECGLHAGRTSRRQRQRPTILGAPDPTQALAGVVHLGQEGGIKVPQQWTRQCQRCLGVGVGGAGSEEVTERDGGSGHGSSFVQTRPGRPVNATAGRPNP